MNQPFNAKENIGVPFIKNISFERRDYVSVDE